MPEPVAGRARDILERWLAAALEGCVDPPHGLLVHPVGKADSARLGELLQACGDIDGVAVDTAGLVHDDVAGVHADSQRHPPIGWGLRELGRAACRERGWQYG